MNVKSYSTLSPSKLGDFFRSVFTDSEGPEEGELIGNLVRDIVNTTPPGDLDGFVAVEEQEVFGAILFSRLRFSTQLNAFILAPVAVHSAFQGRGIGQRLIRHGIMKMREAGVSLLMTYGDPAFYGKVGFNPVSTDLVPSPLPLSRPEGWLGQSLTDHPIEPVPGPASCVKTLADPVYW